MDKQLTAAYEKHGDWYAAYIEEIPGVNTQGRTIEEARVNLEDALSLFLETNRELAQKELSGKEGIVEEPFGLVEEPAA